jgi:hypothetical protein
MCLVTFDHEALGHGSMCLALGGHIRILTSAIFRCDLRSSWIDPAGPLGNIFVGTLSLFLVNVVPRRAAGARLFLWPSAAVARGVARTAWIVASIGAALAAVAYSGVGFADLRDAVLEIGAASLPLLVIPLSDQQRNEPPTPVHIRYSRIAICASMGVYLIFVATLGRGLRF